MLSVGAMLLSDARFPAGGHAHSGGLEPAAAAGTVTSVASLEVFLCGRLSTAGLVAAGLAAAACARARRTGHATAARTNLGERDEGNAAWAEFDAETDARIPSPAQREASRRQGRALLRASRAAWPNAWWLADLATQTTRAASPDGEYRGGPHHPVVLGAAAAASSCTPREAAEIAAYLSVSGPASAAVRLLALDPMRAAAVLAGLAEDIGNIAERAAACAEGPLSGLPFRSAPALDLLAEAHTRTEVRLFES
jgi:urease accessory protein